MNKTLRPFSLLPLLLFAALAAPEMARAASPPLENRLNYPLPISRGIDLTGQITNIDSVNSLIQIKDQDGIIREIHVDPDNVSLLKNGQPTTLFDLSYGDTITVAQK
jgi:hypothetical protein